MSAFKPLPWHEVTRRLSDGTFLRVSPVIDHPDLVNVSVMSPNGWMMYQGTMPMFDALAEIPYQIDRGRAVDATIATEVTDAETVTE